MTALYDRAVVSAKRLIAKYGQPCTWLKPAGQLAGAKPWRDERDGEPPSYPVSIAWFPPGKTNPLFALIPQTEVPECSEIGIMAPGGFEPQLADTINRGGFSSKIVHMDRLAPNGTPVLYTLFVKNPGQGSGF